MGLGELLHGKLLEFKRWIVSKANGGSEIEKKWATDWFGDNIEPPSNHIPFNVEFDAETSFSDRIEKISKIQKPSFFLHLVSYQLILEDYRKQDYVAALEKAFTLQFLIGKDEGKREEKRRNILRNADWQHQHKQDAALSYYKRFSLHELKTAQAAADEIDFKANTKLSHETIYDYVRYYRKRVDSINSEIPKLESAILDIIGGSGELTTEAKKMLSDKVEAIRLEEISKLRFVSAKAVKR